MANEIILRNLGGKQAVKVISTDEGQVILATEENVPLQPSNPGGKLDEFAIHDNEAGEISALDAKASPISTDLVLGEDSENGFEKVKFAVGDLGGGGGGATTFDGLTDTPVNKTGADGFLVKVNGTDLAFLDPATFALSGHDHSGVYSPVAHDHAGVYSPVAHDHSGVYSPVAHTHTDFLLKTGGIMSGNIDFSDVQEGIRFWDTDAAYFKAFYFDDGLGMIVIGDDATGLGGPPQVWSKTLRFNVGFNGFGLSEFGLWEDTAGDFKSVLSLNDAGDFGVGHVDHVLDLRGSGAAPTWNNGPLPAPAPDYSVIPQYGSGPLAVHFIHALAVILSPDDSNQGRVSARDVIHTIKGSAGTLQFKLDGSLFGYPGPSAQSADPTAAYLDFTVADIGTAIIQATVFDGIGNQHMAEIPVIVQDPYGLANP